MESFKEVAEATARSPQEKIRVFLKKKADRDAHAKKLYQEREKREADAKKTSSTNEAKKASFGLNDLDVVDYKPGEDKHSKRNANKRKKADIEHESVELEGEQIDEVLNVAQRRKRAIITKRNKAKLKRGRQKASRRIADKDRLKNRARRQAKAELVKKLTKGVAKGNLSPQRKAEVERRLQKMDARVQRSQKKLLPSVRKRDRGL